jgi:putative polyhydroxyalkanoate system protein
MRGMMPALGSPPVTSMPKIDIEHSHSKSTAAARKAVERVAAHIAERFDVSYGWQGNVCHFERAGVHGRITLSPKRVHVHAELGLMLLAIRGPIEREVRRYLDEEFA